MSSGLVVSRAGGPEELPQNILPACFYNSDSLSFFARLHSENNTSACLLRLPEELIGTPRGSNEKVSYCFHNPIIEQLTFNPTVLYLALNPSALILRKSSSTPSSLGFHSPCSSECSIQILSLKDVVRFISSLFVFID